MTWAAWGLLAGLLLGTYDFLTKLALREQPVLAVIAASSALGALLWAPALLAPQAWGMAPLALSPRELALLWPRSAMMVGSAVLSYCAVQGLPLSISAGVRASGPLWTAMGALLMLGEFLNAWQWMGLLVSMLAYYGFARIGQREGIHFARNGWVLCMLAATLLSSACALYDRYIVAGLGMDWVALQAWSAQQRAACALLLLPWVVRGLRMRGPMRAAGWGAVVAMALCFTVAEFIYLAAVQIEGALISVISVLRRANLVAVFALGALFLRERHMGPKLVAIAGVLLGIVLTLVG